MSHEINENSNESIPSFDKIENTHDNNVLSSELVQPTTDTKTTVNDCLIQDTNCEKTESNSTEDIDENVETDTPNSTPSHTDTTESNNNEKISELQNVLLQQRKRLEDQDKQRLDLEQKYQQLGHFCASLDSRLQIAIKQCDAATKEKEAMVMRYVTTEKGVLEQKTGRENAERKLQEAVKEKDLLQYKLNGMVSEKARICQLLDNKCYEIKGVQQEVDRLKSDLSALETKLKWSQNSLKTEIELHKESATKVELLTNRLQEATAEIDKTKKDTQESIKAFYQSQDNRAYVLDKQLKEQQAILILEKHEREEKEQQNINLKFELDRLQQKHQLLIQENNSLSLKVQQLERERLENEQKLSELRGCADKNRQDEAQINSLTSSVEQLKLQLLHEQEQREADSKQVAFLKERNSELETDMDACRVREAEMLLFTQQLTDKNVRLQSEFSSLETKVQQLTCEQTLLKRNSKEHETRANCLSKQLDEERILRQEESQMLALHLAEKTKLSEQLAQELEDQKGENSVIKRKLELSVKEVTKELQQSRKKLEQFEKAETSTNSRSSSNSSLIENPSSSPSPINVANSEHNDHHVIQPENVLDRQVLIDHIIKLQRISAKKSEKLDFLEEHVQTLVMELQRKSRLLQSYMLREQAGALSSNKMDDNKGNKLRQS